MIPGLFPQVGGRRGGFGSFAFAAMGAGNSPQYLTAPQNDSAVDQTRWSCSFWMKRSLAPVAATFFIGANDEDFEVFIGFDSTPSRPLRVLSDTGVSTRVETTTTGVVPLDGAWHHYFACWDSTQATSDNRVRMWGDGVFIADSGTAPGASASFNFFSSLTDIIYIGGDEEGAAGAGEPARKLAFIEVFDGLSLTPTDVAFDNGGTWTRKAYAGSYGTLGFRLDGSTGLTDAVNGRAFTGVSGFTEASIDFSDLPPYTS